MPVRRNDVLKGGEGRASRGAAVGARQRLPVGCRHDRARVSMGTMTWLSGQKRTARLMNLMILMNRDYM